MIRVLHIGLTPSLGGMEVFIMNYYRNIDKTKIQFDFINMYDKLCFEDEFINLGAKIYKVSNVKKNPIKYFFELRKKIKDNNYKIVHIHMLSAANILPVIAAKTLKVEKIIVHSHNADIPKGLLRKILNKLNKIFVCKLANSFYACSKKAGEWMFTENVKFEVISNAIDLDKFKFNERIRGKCRKKFNLDKQVVIGHVGRFVEQKNHEELIEIFNEIHKRKNNTVLLLIGNGPLERKIKNKVNALNLSDSVIFGGIRTNVNELMQAMDIFLLPSLFEGLPVVGIEAQAAGLLSVFSDCVTPDVKVTESTIFISLNKTYQEWAKIIISTYNKFSRRDTSKDIINAGFEIKKEAIELESKYLNNTKGN